MADSQTGAEAPKETDGEAVPAEGQEAAAASPPAAAFSENIAAIDRTTAAAVATLRRAEPKHKGSDPLYNIPWYLFLGPSSESVEQLLRAVPNGDILAPGQAEPAGETLRWWNLRRAIGISWPSTLLCSHDDRERWQVVEHAMESLLKARKHLPVNGIVVVVPVADLVDGSGRLDRLARVIRDIVNEMRTTLKFSFPTTVVVTGLDQLTGHDAFFGGLDRTTEQALGIRLDDAMRQADVRATMASTFAQWRDRLHEIRMSLLRQPAEKVDMRGVFRFIPEFERLEAPLAALVETLFSESPGDNRRPQWRALYLTAPGSREPHLKDLFDHFLPVDASLATRA